MKLFIKCYYFFYKIDKRFIIRDSIIDLVCLDILELETITFMKIRENYSVAIFSDYTDDRFYGPVIYKALYRNYKEWLTF